MKTSGHISKESALTHQPQVQEAQRLLALLRALIVEKTDNAGERGRGATGAGNTGH